MYRVVIHMISDLYNATFNSIEYLSLDFVKHIILELTDENSIRNRNWIAAQNDLSITLFQHIII